MIYISIILGILKSVSSTPIPSTETTVSPTIQAQNSSEIAQNPLENLGITLDSGSLVEGDVRLVSRPRPAIERLMDGSSLPSNIVFSQHHGPAGPATEKDLWSDNIVPFVLDTNLNETEQYQITVAMETIMTSSDDCVEFVARTTEPDFIYITANDKACWSDIGRIGGNQTVSVSRASGCVTKGIVMHELMHALGFGHEHSRNDRDKYINIIKNNILFGHQSDFKKSNRKILVPEYDYYSLMHYKTTEFSKDSSRLKTIDIKQRGVDESIVGQREFLSEKDKLRIKLLYGCPTS